jgi:RND family efflux transporter MFP subunit
LIRSRPAFGLIVSLLASSAFAEDPASVAVQTEAPREGVVPDLVTAYGSAAPALDGGMTLGIQQEGRVQALAVTPGETVHAGERLLDFAASAAAVSTYQQAVSALSAARQQRSHTAQLLAQQLATRDQLAQVDKAVADAQATLDALRREDADRPSQTLTAPFDGIVATIPVAQGDRVPLGAPLMIITRLDGLVVTVGIEPGIRTSIHPGEAVHLVPLSGGTQLDGQVLRVDGMLNPRTRLVDADVSVPAGSVISGAAFRADIKVGDLRGWIVPHDAVLSDASGTYVFQVAGTTAARVDVKVAGAAGSDDVVQGALDPKRPIVVEGNYQLSDKTPVRMSEASPPSTSQADVPPTIQAGARPTTQAGARPTSAADARSTSEAR